MKTWGFHDAKAIEFRRAVPRWPAGKEREGQGSPLASYRIGCRLLLIARATGRAQSTPAEQGMDAGNYNIQQTIEFGYRLNEVNGNQDTYDTFVNLGSGVRLFDYTLDMRSLNHQGLFFDNLTFQQLWLRRRPERCFAAAHRQEQVVRLPRAVPARQEFLGLQSVRQPAQSGGAEPGRIADDRLHRQPAFGRCIRAFRVTARIPRCRRRIRRRRTILCAACRITI